MPPPLGLWIWGIWPVALTLHVFGAAVIVGFAIILSLRLLGIFNAIPAISLTRLIPFIWVCVGLQIVSGIVLSLTRGGYYLDSETFQLKMVLVVVGCVTTFYARRALIEESDPWFFRNPPKWPAVTSLIWGAVLIVPPDRSIVCPIVPPCILFPFFRTSVLALVVLGLSAAAIWRLDKQVKPRNT